MLYTGKGDRGKTGLFGCNQRISKSSEISEALGALDEVNSFLGIIKVKSREKQFEIVGQKFAQIIHNVQKNLFIIQAEIAGTPMTISNEKLTEVEKIISEIEKELPPIHSFFISGGTELTALIDFARTLSRRAERRVVAVAESQDREVGEFTLAYLNRLSSLLYALARLTNHISGVKEEKPDYE